MAPAESTKDRSNAIKGSASAIAPIEIPNARVASVRRPRARAASPTVAIHAARSVDPPAPASSAYSHATGMPTAAAIRPTSTRAATRSTRTSAPSRTRTAPASTSTRCMPDTAKRCERPLPRKLRSSSGFKSLSPRTSARAMGATSVAKLASMRRRIRARVRSIHASEAAGPMRPCDVQGPARSYDVPQRFGWAGVASRVVPQALRRSQRGHDFDLVAPRQRLGSAIERRAALPADGCAVALKIGELGVPPKRTANQDRGRIDSTAGVAARRLGEDRVGAIAITLVPLHRRAGTRDPDGHRHGHDRDGAHPHPTRANREDEHERGRRRHLPRGPDGKPAGRQRDAREEDNVDRFRRGIHAVSSRPALAEPMPARAQPECRGFFPA